MKLWQQRAIGILDIGGGAIGVYATFVALVSNPGIGTAIVVIPFVLLYCFAIFTGVLTLEGSDSAIRANWWLWIAQIPIFSSHILTYAFSCGALIAASIQLSPMNYNLNWMVGSQFKITINQPQPLVIGVNIFALVVFIWLHRLRARPAP